MQRDSMHILSCQDLTHTCQHQSHNFLVFIPPVFLTQGRKPNRSANVVCSHQVAHSVSAPTCRLAITCNLSSWYWHVPPTAVTRFHEVMASPSTYSIASFICMRHRNDVHDTTADMVWTDAATSQNTSTCTGRNDNRQRSSLEGVSNGIFWSTTLKAILLKDSKITIKGSGGSFTYNFPTGFSIYVKPSEGGSTTCSNGASCCA